MNQPFNQKIGGNPRILVAPLDWGLGHATRCIPVIRELLAQGCEVFLAGEGAQKELLSAEFPSLTFLKLEGYRIQYAKTAKGLLWKMIQQAPQLFRTIRYENKWLKKIVAQNNIDAVISDNRYGLYHKKTPCIFITHQLTIKSNAGKWTEKILQKRNYKYINRFSECWVPDAERENNLAGELSHPKIKPAVPLHYAGLLSRFTKHENINKIKDHLLFILSGPEPQRSILEEKIINDISHYNFTATIVRGLPGSSSLIPSTNMIKFYNHLPAAQLNTAIQEAEYVISRSGYSSVMDIITLQKKSIFIPTAGQTEQEYLGNYLMKKGIAVCIQQKDFSLTKALSLAAEYNYQLPVINSGTALSKMIENFLHQLSAPALG